MFTLRHKDVVLPAFERPSFVVIVFIIRQQVVKTGVECQSRSPRKILPSPARRHPPERSVRRVIPPKAIANSWHQVCGSLDLRRVCMGTSIAWPTRTSALLPVLLKTVRISRTAHLCTPLLGTLEVFTSPSPSEGQRTTLQAESRARDLPDDQG